MMKIPKDIDDIIKDIKVARTFDDLKTSMLDLIDNIGELNYDENLAEMESRINKLDDRMDSTNERINKLPGADSEE